MVKNINWFKIFLQFTGTSESGEGVGEAKVVITAHEWTKTDEGVTRWEQPQLSPLQSFSGEHICYQQQFHVATSCLLSTITFSGSKTNSGPNPTSAVDYNRFGRGKIFRNKRDNSWGEKFQFQFKSQE